MATTVRTINFLPEIFQTIPNRQFLSATLDVLTQQPKMTRVNGYIGRKFGYGVSSQDHYVTEPNTLRDQYQLEPAVVFTKKETSKAVDVITYPGIIDAVKLAGGLSDNHNNLFSSDFYSWDSFIELDKLINYSQYYWLPNGPEPVVVTNITNFMYLSYNVKSNDIDYSMTTNKFSIPQENPDLILVRGGVYEFVVDQDTPFWIQTEPGVTGKRSSDSNFSSREIYGLSNNGATKGTIKFNVPLSDEQQGYIYPFGLNVDLVTTLRFDDIHDKFAKNISIDGVTDLNGKTVIFYGTSAQEDGEIDTFYDMTNGRDAYDSVAFDQSTDSRINKHVYKITYIGDSYDNYVISLSEVTAIPDNRSIDIRFGNQYSNRQFVKNSYDIISLIPLITAPFNTLYYQDGNVEAKVGKIKLIDAADAGVINVEEIVGAKTYTSPNGIKFTNGLKVQFSGHVIPEKYTHDLYYVEGVGTSITLVPASDLSVPEPFSEAVSTVFDDFSNPFDSLSYSDTFFYPKQQDYITINRSATNKNAWSRSNRWFHAEVLRTTIENNLIAPACSNALNNPDSMAKRPIIEFYPNLKLFNHGVTNLGKITFIDTTATDALNQVNGQIFYQPDGDTSYIFDGAKIIFANDSNLEVRNKIYEAHVGTIVNNDSMTVNGLLRKVGQQVVFSINRQSTPATVGKYYNVSGNSASFNGIYMVTDATPTTVTLFYPTDPGSFDPGSPTTIVPQPEIVLAPIADVTYNDMVVVTGGEVYSGKTFYFDGTYWKNSQQKTNVNQPPKFDLFDINENSLGDSSYYPSTDFSGCTLFEYKVGTGANDPILGFPISYADVNNLGDILYNVSINTDTFNYTINGISTTAGVKNSVVHNHSSNVIFERCNGWQTAVEESFQYQIFNFKYTGVPATPVFTLDVAIKSSLSTAWPTLVVYVDNQRVDSSLYTVTVDTSSTIITLVNKPTIGTTVSVMGYSDQVSKIGYYEIPSNLENNPFNEDLSSITLGDIRGHYKSICNNVGTSLVGKAFGPNNFRDLGNVVPFGTRIIQHSASVVAAASFLRNDNKNFFSSLTFNSYEYEKYKTLIANTVVNNDFDLTRSDNEILDEVISFITQSRLPSGSFFWSDMLPAKTPAASNTYTFKTTLPVSFFKLSKVYSFTEANYSGVLVYLTRTVDGVVTTRQLVKDIDYVVSDTIANLEILIKLVQSDKITINEYTQTYGNYVPNTPTKLGLYPSYVPEVVFDSTYVTPSYFIRGHDGSYTKLYGQYKNGLTDLRDKLLLEFELRIFNNLKTSNEIALTADSVLPGAFRDVGQSFEDINRVYSVAFLNWVGSNRINYATQSYDAHNEYTWNFKGSTLKYNNSVVKTGHWRGISLWLYDTATPASTPWEMLGLTKKPLWWDSHYGSAPYTSGNTLMWTDISNGYVWNNGNSYVVKSRIRPALLSILPVDSYGNMISPFTASIGNYNISNFKNDWQVGDMGPAEYAYRKSSTWPFDLMRLMALVKPAKFFAYNIDVDSYRYNAEFNQFLVNDNHRGSFNEFELYGKDSTTAHHGYANWIVDYLKQYGIDGSVQITDMFDNCDVRLTYRLAGFSDKNHLRFFNETSASSKPGSLLIPDDSYSVLLYNNQPTDSLVYSSLIIQRSTNGYKVYGNGQINAYFTVLNPKTGIFDTITLGDSSVQIPKYYFTDSSTVVPYGAEFTTVVDLLTFVKGYGLYLTSQGFQFDDVENGVVVNWDQMLTEILYWVNTGWAVGSTINVNPAANSLTFDNHTSIIQPLTIQNENFILNQNLLPIQINDLSVDRDGTYFSVKSLNSGDSICFFNGTVSTLEHVVVFDNKTIFNDLIYNPVTGLRQQRLVLKGSKSAEWDGSLNAQGFIINQDNILDWVPNKKYIKGTVVKYKNSYWMANAGVIQPSPSFDVSVWDQTTYDMVQQSMLPNPSTKSSEAILYYDTNNPNLATDADLLSFSLIGYRPREYFAATDLSDSTQVSVFKNMIQSKGSLDAALGLNNIKLNNTTLDYSIHENWAIKNSEYGGVLNHNFVEIKLDQSKLTGNPSILSVIQNESIDGSQQEVPVYGISNYSRNVSNNIFPTVSTSFYEKLPSAGYVNLNDVMEIGYDVTDFSTAAVSSIYKGDYLWAANRNSKWDIFTPVNVKARVTGVINNLNGTITVQFESSHGLLSNQVFAILNFDTRINGYYVINSTPDLRTVVVTSPLPTSVTSLTGSGIAFLLQSQRVDTGRDLALLPLLNTEYDSTKVWVDEGVTGDWVVYEKTNNYVQAPITMPENGLTLGDNVMYVDNIGYFVSDSSNARVYQYRDSPNNDGTFFLAQTLSAPTIYQNGHQVTDSGNFGTGMAQSDDFVVITSLTENKSICWFHFYRKPVNINTKSLIYEQSIPLPVSVPVVQTITAGKSLAFSGDGTVLYAGIDYYNSRPTENDFSYEAVATFVKDPDFFFNSLGLILAEPTIFNSTYFVVEGNYPFIASEGQRVTFVTGYTPIATFIADPDETWEQTSGVPYLLLAGNNYFCVSGDNGNKFPVGTEVSFGNAGELGNNLYAVTHTAYIPQHTKQVKRKDINGSYVIVNGQFVYDTVTISAYTQVYVEESILTSIPVNGYNQTPTVYSVSFSQDITYTISTSLYDSDSDTTTYFINEKIQHTTTAGAGVYKACINYQFIGTTQRKDPVYGEKFGYSLATNYDGSKLFIGTPKYDLPISNIRDVGTVYVADILIEQYQIKYDQNVHAPWLALTLPWAATTNSIIYWNDKPLATNKYVVIPGSTLLGTPTIAFIGPVGLKAGDILKFKTFNLVISQQVMKSSNASDFRPGEKFGYSVSSNKYGSEFIVGAPFAVDANGNDGEVIRFTSEGKKYGTLTASSPGGLVGNNAKYLLINGFRVTLPVIGNMGAVADAINACSIPNVIALATEDLLTGYLKLVIKLINTDLGQTDNKLNVVSPDGIFSEANVLTNLFLASYNISQKITNPHPQQNSQFGAVVKFNELNSFIVGAPTTTKYIHARFDYDSAVDIHYSTVFDNNLTQFEDDLGSSGAVYMFDYIPSYGETLTNTSNFAFAQACNEVDTVFGYLPMYGNAVDFNHNVVMVGAPKYKPTTAGGKFAIFKNATGKPNWSPYRVPNNVVDISKVKKAQLYNNVNDERIVTLDYVDPLQGKLLGAVSENLDYITSTDPAGYNSAGKDTGKLVWGENQVGKIWFDTSTTKFLNYHQDDIVYNSNYWGQVFPGSKVDVYSWVMSNTPPNQYTDTTGTVYDVTKYSVTFTTDSNNNLIPKYFYWVKNTNTLFSRQGKTLSDSTLTQYIVNPKNSGIPFIAPLRPDTVAFYNAQSYINGLTTSLYLGYSKTQEDASGHLDFKLIRNNYPSDFLPGFPDRSKDLNDPFGLYEKLIDSFAGADIFGAIVPDPALPKMLQIGVSVRPRQSMFVDRLTALKNYINYVNSIIAEYPIVELENISLLNTSGQTFNTNTYWTYSDWWATGYSSTTRTDLEVQRYPDLLTISATAREGMLVGVAENGKGNREVYLYTNSTWERVGLYNGTIQFLSSLYDYKLNKSGFGNEFFDASSYDMFPTIETRYIIRAINEQIFVGDLFEYRNKALILMFEYIQSENVISNGYLPWLNKTSFADVKYNVKKLSSPPRYNVENTSLLSGYIDEIKPYHVVIKEFSLSYQAEDVVGNFISDFDIPTFYDANFERFVSPQLTFQRFPNNQYEYTTSSSLWESTAEHKIWFDNYGLSFTDLPNTVVAFVKKFIGLGDVSITLDNVHGMPVAGLIRIETELIGYTLINRETGVISGLSRGFGGTQVAEHLPGVEVVMNVPSVSVVHSGRNYTAPPIVTSYIDLTKYPAPRVEAQFEAVMSEDKVIEINTINVGEGYVTTPEIIVEPSISHKFNLSGIGVNSQGNNVFIVDTTDFITGDLIRSVGVGDNGITVVENGYYYINVLVLNSKSYITLHVNYHDSFTKNNSVKFIDVGYLSTNYSHTISVGAHAIANANQTLVRSMTSTLKFDRTSYTSKVVEWTPNTYWSSAYVSPNMDLSDIDSSLSYSVPYVSQTGTVSPTGGHGAVFTVFNWIAKGVYEVTTTTGGSGYSVDNTITISGLNLQGKSTENDVTFKVASVDNSGAILTIKTVTGTPATITKTSLQGAVLPILGITANNDNNVTVQLDYSFSGLLPGQINGVEIFFYRIHSPYTYTEPVGGAVFEIFRPTFNDAGASNSYYMKLLNAGTGYVAGQTLRVLGSLLGGEDGINDAIITIRQVHDISNGVYISKITGVSKGDSDKFYTKPINNTEVEIYSDPRLTTPVKISAFMWDGSTAYIDPITNEPRYGYPGTDYGYVPQPLRSNLNSSYTINSLVTYAGAVWECLVSNHDATFDVNKWVLISESDIGLNAIDRINAFYNPGHDLPAKDIKQLLKGITYPNPVYLGQGWGPDEQLPIETILRDTPFFPKNPNIKGITFDGNTHYAILDSDTTSAVIKNVQHVWNSDTISETPLNVTSIAYGNGAFVITTTTPNTSLLVSFDSKRWVSIGNSVSYDDTLYDVYEYDNSNINVPAIPLNKAKYINGKYFALGSKILQSKDVFNWDTKFDFGSRLENNLYDITYVESSNYVGYVTVGSGYIVTSGAGSAAPIFKQISRLLTSRDGESWTLAESITDNPLHGVASDNSVIVVVGDNGTILYSNNTHIWVQSALPSTATNANIKGIVFGLGMFIAVGDKLSDTDPAVILKSTDGINWADHSSAYFSKENLVNVMFDGTFFYAVGDNNTIIKSSDGELWTSQADLSVNEPEYVIKGDDFLFGYGPEELVPGLVSDTISMLVNTAPSAYWDVNTQQDLWYKNTGFSMNTVTASLDNSNSISFKDVSTNPMVVSVFVMDNTTKLKTRIYTESTTNSPYMYTVDWNLQKVTLNNSVDSSHSVTVEVYEVGNCVEISRGNSHTTPIRLNDLTSYSHVVLDDILYHPVINDPIVFVNGEMLEYGVDYTIGFATLENSQPLMSIEFTQAYSNDDYITWSIIGDSALGNNLVQYDYSLPETELFIGNGTDYTITGSVTGDNIDSGLVEVNGKRLTPTTDYSWSGNVVVLNSSLTSSDLLAITTYNDTTRLFMVTQSSTASGSSTTIVFNSHVVPYPMPDMTYTDVSKVWATINGYRVDTSRLSFSSDNHLVISGTTTGDVIVATVSVDGGSPNPMSFRMVVDKAEKREVYQTNPANRTWLIQDLNKFDSVIHVNDLNRIVDRVTFTKQVTTLGNDIGFLIDYFTSSVVHVSAFNADTLAEISMNTIKLTSYKGSSGVSFAQGVKVGDVITITLFVGGLVEINGERITYKTIDPVTNTITDFVRGVQGTAKRDHHKQYQYVTSFSLTRKLDPHLITKNWVSDVYSQSGDPLQLSTTTAAKFLKTGE